MFASNAQLEQLIEDEERHLEQIEQLEERSESCDTHIMDLQQKNAHYAELNRSLNEQNTDLKRVLVRPGWTRW